MGSAHMLCMQEEKLVLPLAVQTQMEAYAGRYFILKAPRRLVWRPHLGTVDLALTVGERRLEFSVSPLQATIILPFQVGTLLSMWWRNPGSHYASCLAQSWHATWRAHVAWCD